MIREVLASEHAELDALAATADVDELIGALAWRSARARRLSILIDAEDYFAALDETLHRARHSIWIMGWDLDTRVRLRPRDSELSFGELLERQLERQPRLTVHCLIWSLIGVRAGGRELPPFNARWMSHPRIRFRYDAERPIESSRHEKLIVIDGALAFVGGTDVSRERWDARGHDRTVEHLRVNPEGEPYRPHHDLQAVMDGPIVRALAEHFADAWQTVAGERPDAAHGRPELETSIRARSGVSAEKSAGEPRGEATAGASVGALWPERVPIDVEWARVHLSRTAPPFRQAPAIDEIRRTVEAIIARARRLLYIEMQYLTAAAVTRALCSRLAAADAPHVLLVLPRHNNTLLERRVMQPLQDAQLCELLEHDRHARLRITCPTLPDGHGELMLHSKLTIADDEVLHLGSANFNERSMAVDTEIDFTLCAHDAGERAAIANVRHRLLAEHLGVPLADIAADGPDPARLFARVDRSARAERGLHPYPIEREPAASWALVDAGLADPTAPYGTHEMNTLELDAGEVRKRLWTGLATLGAACVALALLWTLTPAEEWFRAWLIERGAERSALSIAGVVLALTAASLVMMPITLITVVCFVLLGPWFGMGAALSVSLGSAALGYGLGRWLNDRWLERLSGSRLEALKAKLADAAHGVPLVVAIRFLPIAPFTAVNLAIGASEIRFAHFMIGSFIGLLPGKLLIAVFADRALRLIEDPSWQSVLAAALVALVTITLAWLGARWLERRSGGSSP